ncbi:MAG: acyltransferase [Candidatus Hodarchaeota archaeon]
MFSPFSEVRNPHLIAIGNKTNVGSGCLLWAIEKDRNDQEVKIGIGNNVLLFRNATIVAMKKIIIGNYCLIAENVTIRDQDHAFTNSSKPIKSQGFVINPVILEDNVWVGTGTTILRGVRIGKGSVIGANSVVKKSIPSYSIAAGIPAKVVKIRDNSKRDTYEDLVSN